MADATSPPPDPPPARRRARRALAALLALAAVALAVAIALVPEGLGDAEERRAGRTVLVPAPSGPAVVWAVGDGADGGEPAKALAARIEAERPARFLYLGDVYEQGTAEEFRRNYETVYGRLAERTSPTPGNHEWGNREQGYSWWWRQATGEAPPPWYELRIGGWQLLSLNTQTDHGEDSEQVRWLRERVAEPGTCRIAFQHRPRFSGGNHGDQPDVQPLWAPLRGRAAMALGAHDHASQRMAPRDGIVQFVAGAGGHDLNALDDPAEDEDRVFGDDETVAGLRLELHRDRAEAAFVAADGRVLDRTTVPCEPG